MKFTVADLLDQLSPTEPLTVEALEKALGVSAKAERQQLRIGLDALERLSLVEESAAGLRRQPGGDLIPARLRCSSKGFCFALRDDGGEDIYIRDHQLNHAWNGDRVLVRITREGGRRRSPEGGCSASSSATPPACSPRWNSRGIGSWPFPSMTGC